MDVRLSREQELISATAARLGAQHAISGIRDLPPTPEQSAAAWDALARADLLGLAASADSGESGAAVATALVTEQLAEELCPAPYIGQGVLAPALLAATGAETDAVLMARGELRYCVLLAADLTRIAGPDEPAVAFDAFGRDAWADGRCRRGAAPASPSAVERPGDAWIAPGSVPALGTTVAALPIPASCSGSARSTSPARDRITALAQTALAADALGLAERALAMAVQYAGERRQFGRVIGANQALAHLLADAAVLVEACRSTVWHAAWAVDALGTGRCPRCGDARKSLLQRGFSRGPRDRAAGPRRHRRHLGAPAASAAAPGAVRRRDVRRAADASCGHRRAAAGYRRGARPLGRAGGFRRCPSARRRRGSASPTLRTRRPFAAGCATG